MHEATTRVPTALHVRVMLPVLIVQSLTLWLGAIHAIKTDPIEVALRVSLGLEHDRVPVLVAAALAVGHVRIFERVEAVDDVLDRAVADDIFDREDVDLGEGVEVAADCCVPTGAAIGAVAEKVATLLVEAFVETRLEATTGVVDRT